MLGSESEEEAKKTSRKVARTLQKLVAWYPRQVCNKTQTKVCPEQLKVINFKIVNISASTQLPWDIRLLVSNHATIQLFMIPTFPTYRTLPKETENVFTSPSCPRASPIR